MAFCEFKKAPRLQRTLVHSALCAQINALKLLGQAAAAAEFLKSHLTQMQILANPAHDVDSNQCVLIIDQRLHGLRSRLSYGAFTTWWS